MRKLNIKIEDRWLDVPENAKLKIKRVNNIFYDSAERKSFSFNIAIPFTPTNNSIIGWIFDIGEPNNSITSYEAKLYDNFDFVQFATLSINKTDKNYQCSVVLDDGTVDLLSSEKNVRDIKTFYDIAANAANTGDYPAEQTWFDVCNFQAWRPFTERSMGENFCGNHLAPYLITIMKEALKVNGWNGESLSGSFIDDTELQQLHFINYHSTNQSEHYNPLVPNSLARTLPNITIKDMFDSLSKMFGARLFYNQRNKTVRFELLGSVINNPAINWSDKVARNSLKRTWSRNVVGGITFKWSSEFYSLYKLKEPDSEYSLGYKDNDAYLFANGGNDGETVKIITENTIFFWGTPWESEPTSHWYPQTYLGHIIEIPPSDIIGTYADFASLPATADDNAIALVEEENFTYKCKDNTWRRFSFYSHSLKVGDGAKTITSKIGSVITDTIGDGLNDLEIRKMPVIPYHGNRAEQRDGGTENDWDELPPLLAFNRGEGVTTGNDAHPSIAEGYYFSSSDIYDTRGNQVGNYRLSWETDNGLYNTFHKKWYEYVSQGQEVEFMAHLTIQDIAELDLSVPIHVHGAEGFIREITYELPLIAPVRVVFVKRI